MSINLNTVAREVTLEEGLKKSMTVAQVKEVHRITFTMYDLEELVLIWLKYNKEKI